MARVSGRLFQHRRTAMLVTLMALSAWGGAAPPALKVCADPHNPPFSNQEQQGFENKIAELFARDLGLAVQYTWFPQRIGFIRNTLKKSDGPGMPYLCDLVMGVPSNFELAATTRPYYRSSWAMVYVKGRGLDDIKSQEDLIGLAPERKKDLRIGLFDVSPAALWVARHGLMEFMTPYPMLAGDARAYPGQIIEQDLIDDRINLTFVWGPIAGYVAKRTRKHEVVVIPMRSEPGVKFDYQIAMAVRHGDDQRRKRIQALIDKHRETIRALLVEYGVPLLEDP
ncbi:MAG: quinoprotein dehydrogenase-associated putative ABC transporter substrate-binding protein [Gammaproteobacteria bacterium]